MGNIEQEQAEAMKRYIREVFIPEYAKNFNKELSASDIKFYGKIHFDRGRSDNELNMHCHLIVSRKDQSNKKKLSPLTNHKSTKKGVIKGGFDRVNLFQQAERKFDKLFNFNRQQTESFDYYNTMKNSPIAEQLKLQEPEFQSSGKKTEINQSSNLANLLPINLKNKETENQAFNIDSNTSVNLSPNQRNNQTSSSSNSVALSEVDFPHSSIKNKCKIREQAKKGRRLDKSI